jgi:excisionase family DNA binding protein
MTANYLAPDQVPESEFYTTREVANMFKVTPVTIRKWVHEGKLRCVYINTHMRIPRSSVAELANHQWGTK